MGDIHPEYIFLGFLAEGPAHGYQLYQLFKEDLEGIWHISESQMYASLKRLEKRQWIVLDASSGGGSRNGIGGVDPKSRKSRQRFMLTSEGRAVYEAWLRTPTPVSPRLLKLEFLSRLYFALRRDVELAFSIIDSQRVTLETELNRLQNTSQRDDSIPLGTAGVSSKADRKQEVPFHVTSLAKDFRLNQIRAALEWLRNLGRESAVGMGS